MKQVEFDTLVADVTDSIFAFAEFTKRTEHLFSDAEDAEALQAYRDAWFELEIVNATALDEWESEGRPNEWSEKWNGKFFKDAADTVGLLRDAALRFVK